MNPRPDIASHQARILIVDDERHNRQLLEVILTPEGFHLLTAASGEEAHQWKTSRTVWQRISKSRSNLKASRGVYPE
jgi:DNA-binding NtrC family response regulator